MAAATNDAAPQAAPLSAPAQDTSSGTSSAAYVIVGLALLALVVVLIARSRAAGKRDA